MKGLRLDSFFIHFLSILSIIKPSGSVPHLLFIWTVRFLIQLCFNQLAALCFASTSFSAQLPVPFVPILSSCPSRLVAFGTSLLTSYRTPRICVLMLRSQPAFSCPCLLCLLGVGSAPGPEPGQSLCRNPGRAWGQEIKFVSELVPERTVWSQGFAILTCLIYSIWYG